MPISHWWWEWEMRQEIDDAQERAMNSGAPTRRDWEKARAAHKAKMNNGNTGS